MKDYAFKINILAGDLERGVLAPGDDDDSDHGSLDDSAPTLTVGLLRRRLPLLN
jgi:hypothetical protein